MLSILLAVNGDIALFLIKTHAGECLLENMRTLCVACHADVTAAQRNERRQERLKAKKHIQIIMRDLKAVVMPDQIENKTEVC